MIESNGRRYDDEENGKQRCDWKNNDEENGKQKILQNGKQQEDFDMQKTRKPYEHVCAKRLPYSQNTMLSKPELITCW